jgi:hypothetical protein
LQFDDGDDDHDHDDEHDDFLHAESAIVLLEAFMYKFTRQTVHSSSWRDRRDLGK